MDLIYRAFSHFKYLFLARKEVCEMVEWFASRVAYGYMTAEKGKQTKERPLVPKRFRTDVIAVLRQMNLDADGQPIAGDEQ